MSKEKFNVLLIEDDPMVREVNKQFIEKVPSFKVVATASNGNEGLALIDSVKPDLVILDIFMPKKDGIEVLRQLRKGENAVDVIVITAANDSETINVMLQNGAIDYIIKPFKFDRISMALEKYQKRYSRLQMKAEITQQKLDEILHATTQTVHKKSPAFDTPKGLNERTLQQILQYLRKQSNSKSAEEVAEGIGIARVTARRYLEYLKEIDEIQLDIQYGGVGRPINRYILR